MASATIVYAALVMLLGLLMALIALYTKYLKPLITIAYIMFAVGLFHVLVIVGSKTFHF